MQTIFQAPTANERQLAVLAHASILLSFVVAIVTSGIGVLLITLIPLFIWFNYRDRSPYVAFHALQATLFQLGALGLMLVAGLLYGAIITAAWVITALLSVIVIGVLLIPVALLLTVVGAIILAGLPLASLGYGLVGAWQVYNTDNFRYYWIADWLEQRV